jgi:hypothetical protein
MSKNAVEILTDMNKAELLARDGLSAETIRKHLQYLPAEWEPIRDQMERIIAAGNVLHEVAIAEAMTKAALKGNYPVKKRGPWVVADLRVVTPSGDPV